jgi:aryl sulfotransferase
MALGRITWPSKTRERQTAIFDSTRWNVFEFRDDDIVIVTWGKSGTTWMQQIVGQLVMDAPASVASLNDSPWLDMRLFPLDGVLDGLEAQRHRRFIKTHLPLDALVFSSKAKYIYVGRDVRDIVWSAYNHHASFTPGAIDMFNNTPGRVGPPLTPPSCDVREYYLQFLTCGEAPGFPLSPLWEHVQGWWNIRHLPNMLLVHFNDLKTDPASEIRRIAAFLEIEIDEAQLPAILEHCSFDYMRQELAKLEEMHQFFTGGGETFVYKGTNGRWKEVLSAQEIGMADQAAARHLTRDCAHWLKTGESQDGDHR